MTFVGFSEGLLALGRRLVGFEVLYWLAGLSLDLTLMMEGTILVGLAKNLSSSWVSRLAGEVSCSVLGRLGITLMGGGGE